MIRYVLSAFEIKLVEAELILNPEKDRETTGQSDGEAGDVDDGEYFLAEEISEGELEVIAKHR